mgnify:CR=1 FL=1
MARERKKVHKIQMTDGKRAIIHQLLDEYDIQTAEDIQDALKYLLGGTIKEMMEGQLGRNITYFLLFRYYPKSNIYNQCL